MFWFLLITGWILVLVLVGWIITRIQIIQTLAKQNGVKTKSTKDKRKVWKGNVAYWIL